MHFLTQLIWIIVRITASMLFALVNMEIILTITVGVVAVPTHIASILYLHLARLAIEVRGGVKIAVTNIVEILTVNQGSHGNVGITVVACVLQTLLNVLHLVAVL